MPPLTVSVMIAVTRVLRAEEFQQTLQLMTRRPQLV